MFSGCGGMDLGFKNAGFHIVWANDNDKSAVTTYQRNIGQINNGDITEIDLNNIPKHNILLAGFPCQAYSNAGNRNGVNDKRGRLYQYTLNAIKIHKPHAIVFENVRGILSIKTKNGKDLISEICDILVQGETVKVSSFGSFSVRQKGGRIGRNPKTGEEVPIAPRRVLVFRPSHVLKDQVNRDLSGPTIDDGADGGTDD